MGVWAIRLKKIRTRLARLKAGLACCGTQWAKERGTRRNQAPGKNCPEFNQIHSRGKARLQKSRPLSGRAARASMASCRAQVCRMHSPMRRLHEHQENARTC